MSANDRQVGGQHYKTSAIEPWDYIIANEIPYLEGQIIRYLSRWRKKNGIEDVYKAKHYLDKLIEVEEKNIPSNFSEEKVRSESERSIHQLDHESHVFVPKLVMKPVLKGYDYPLGTHTYHECHFCGALLGSMLAKQPCAKRPSSDNQIWIERIKQEMYGQPLMSRVYYQTDTNDDHYQASLAEFYYKRMPQTGETTFVGTTPNISPHKSTSFSFNERLPTREKERVFDNHGYSYYLADSCEFGHHVWEPLPDYEAGNVCVHCGIRETK